MVEIDRISRELLRCLCENGRVTATDAGKTAGCSKPTALKKIAELEKSLNLHYTVEPDTQAMGLGGCYLIAAKTPRNLGRRELDKILGKSDVPQFAAICEGDFNLLICAAAKDKMDYLRWAYNVRSALQLAENGPIFWKSSEIIYERLGFFPIRSEIINELDIGKSEKKALLKLNKNSRITLSKLGNDIGVSATAANYFIEKLMKNGCIRRFTALIRKPISGLTVAFFIEKPFLPDHPIRARKSRTLYYFDDGTSLVNRYIMVSELTGHADQFNIANFKDVGEWHSEKSTTEEIFGKSGTRILSAIIVEVVIGEMPARNLNIEKVYSAAEWISEK